MSAPENATIYTHADHPEWGRGIILPAAPGRQDRFDLSFESGGRRVVLRTFASKLQKAEVTPLEASVLSEKLAVRKLAGPPIKVPKKKAGGATSAPIIADFTAQLRLFETLYPGGFAGEKYVADVRGGSPTAKKRKGDKTVALATAAQALRPAAFEGPASEVFDAVLNLAKTSGLVHPLDGTSTLKALDEPQRAAFVAALGELLYGSAPEAERFDKLVASLSVTDERASWSTVTMFQALVQPAQHVCVKPTAFQKQAALVQLPLDYETTPTAPVYAQFLAIARATEESLKKAGQQPRDLVDVHCFICLTHGAKLPASVPAANAA
jgi:hypothetical protein